MRPAFNVDVTTVSKASHHQLAVSASPGGREGAEDVRFFVVLKTTVDLDAAMLSRLKETARAEGRSQAALIREAIAVYLEQRARPKP